MSNLKPCPLCGCTGVMIHKEERDHQYWRVHCAAKDWAALGGLSIYSAEEAEARWNRRP